MLLFMLPLLIQSCVYWGRQREQERPKNKLEAFHFSVYPRPFLVQWTKVMFLLWKQVQNVNVCTISDQMNLGMRTFRHFPAFVIDMYIRTVPMQIACAQLVYQARPSLTFQKSATSAQYNRTWPLKMAQLGRNWYAKPVAYQYDENEASQRQFILWQESLVRTVCRRANA